MSEFLVGVCMTYNQPEDDRFNAAEFPFDLIGSYRSEHDIPQYTFELELRVQREVYEFKREMNLRAMHLEQQRLAAKQESMTVTLPQQNQQQQQRLQLQQQQTVAPAAKITIAETIAAKTLSAKLTATPAKSTKAAAPGKITSIAAVVAATSSIPSMLYSHTAPIPAAAAGAGIKSSESEYDLDDDHLHDKQWHGQSAYTQSMQQQQQHNHVHVVPLHMIKNRLPLAKTQEQRPLTSRFKSLFRSKSRAVPKT
ncbi:hypothetical protein LPJ66_008525 [Kickxella alabastrina]|uniref:Uncharacterized protein n=1 Tax=Kickxella alabastrina TaxID=61397 RepID=A0ACC1IC16_9FUNG|nr:hypothetical protein LPJ66_008525 [Kickxella alabastrina]